MQRVLQVRSTATIAGMKKLKLMLLFFATLLVETSYADLQLNLIELPPGFSIETYAEGVENARQMVRGDNGTIFAGSRRAGKLWAITDADGDQHAEKVRLIDEDLKMPSGVEFLDGALYVGAVDRILRYDNIELMLDQSPLQNEKSWGRPNDVLVMPDGALLVSDDQANVIYRISYTK